MAFVAAPLTFRPNHHRLHRTTARRRSSSTSTTTTTTTTTTTAKPRITCSANVPPPPFTAKDALAVWVENILIAYGGKKATDNIPIAVGDVHDLVGDLPFFEALHRYYEGTGPIYKLAFGPKAFIVLQDPASVRAVLKEGHHLYDKGVLSEVLEDIMGKGLIPADFETWQVRRRAVVPAFHSAWLSYMTGMFAYSTEILCKKLEAASEANGMVQVDMETEYQSLALDIIGKAVFNYEFGSVENESPIVKAVYRVLLETEHRSTMFLPYWKIPGIEMLVPRQKLFKNDMRLINKALKTAIDAVKESVDTSRDLDELERRDYSNVSDPSLLRFLVELRGEETTTKQLRDDMMTMLIAGHETSAALLTWATYELTKNPGLMKRAREEVDRVLQYDQYPTVEDVKKLSLIRRILAETLRLYPAPPLLIRRLLADTTLPQGSGKEPMKLKRGTDIFINTYSLHRRPDLWERALEFDPDRWLRPQSNRGISGWNGYTPNAGLDNGSPLYPTELHADFAYLPFGGGARKCVGDQFAMLESVVALAMLVRRFEFDLKDPNEQVKITTGATMHTENGLMINVRPRIRTQTSGQKIQSGAVKVDDEEELEGIPVRPAGSTSTAPGAVGAGE